MAGLVLITIINVIGANQDGIKVAKNVFKSHVKSKIAKNVNTALKIIVIFAILVSRIKIIAASKIIVTIQ